MLTVVFINKNLINQTPSPPSKLQDKIIMFAV